jgi:hypothetical protein
MDYRQDDALLNLIKGKRVALIGPSSHLVGKGVGNEIDSYDVVCRINDTAAVGYESDYGSRTDVVFCCFAKNSIPEFEYKFRRKIVKKIKLVYIPVVKFVGPDQWRDPGFAPGVVDAARAVVGEIPVSWVGVSNYGLLYDFVGTEPNSGFMSLLALLLHEPAELLLTGYSFYSLSDKIDSCYYGSYITKDMYPEGTWPYETFSPRLGHNQLIQQNCFTTKVHPQWKEKLRLDSFLVRYLDLPHTNILEL